MKFIICLIIYVLSLLFINNARLIPLYSVSYKNAVYAIKFVFHDTVVRII